MRTAHSTAAQVGAAEEMEIRDTGDQDDHDYHNHHDDDDGDGDDDHSDDR